jgi:hypothetical protein
MRRRLFLPVGSYREMKFRDPQGGCESGATSPARATRDAGRTRLAAMPAML